MFRKCIASHFVVDWALPTVNDDTISSHCDSFEHVFFGWVTNEETIKESCSIKLQLNLLLAYLQCRRRVNEI